MLPVDDPTEALQRSEAGSCKHEADTAVVTITALHPRGDKGDSFAIELSSGEALQLRAGTVAERGLIVGDTIDGATMLRLQRDDSNRRAVEAGLNFISYRPRSAKEVADHLRKKSLDATTRDHAIRRLEELGYVDDAAFARFWVESRDTHRPRGRRALAWELRQKGVADAIIEDVVARFAGDEAALAGQAARKRAATLDASDPYKFRRQLGAFLARRGFSYDVVEQVVDELWEELGSDESHCFEKDQ